MDQWPCSLFAQDSGGCVAQHPRMKLTPRSRSCANLVTPQSPEAPLGCVVVGIDDGAWEEQAALTVAGALRARGMTVALMTPAIVGDGHAPGGWRSECLQRLAAAGSFRLPESALCPYRLPAAPDLATAVARSGVIIDLEAVLDARMVLATWVDAVVVMGMGGLCVPLTPDVSAGQLMARLGLPVVLVGASGVNADLGPLRGARLAGWLDAGTPLRDDAKHQASGDTQVGGPRLGSLQTLEPTRLLQALRAQ